MPPIRFHGLASGFDEGMRGMSPIEEDGRRLFDGGGSGVDVPGVLVPDVSRAAPIVCAGRCALRGFLIFTSFRHDHIATA